MSNEPDDLVLDHLRKIRGTQNAHTQALADLKDGQTLIRHNVNSLAGHSVHQEQRLAALEAKMRTVFKRLELRDPKGDS